MEECELKECELSCDIGIIYKCYEKILNYLVDLYPGFERPPNKPRIFLDPFLLGEKMTRGMYEPESNTPMVFCIKGRVCIESLIHEILHSNNSRLREEYSLFNDEEYKLFNEGLTEMLTLYFLKKRLPQCLEHHLTSYECGINKEYELYARLWGSISLKIGIMKLWDYYKHGGDKLLDEIMKKDSISEAEELAQQELKIKIDDLWNILESLQ